MSFRQDLGRLGRSMVPGISAEHIGHRYGDWRALTDVSLTIHPGEVFGLLGPNGAGKTTLLRALAGILAPTEGRARILGVDVREDPLHAKAQLGFLSGDTALYARLTVREILAYFGRLHRLQKPEIERRIEAVAQDFELGAFLDKRSGALSSGQKQRANLARAFLTDPPVLILDEPTVGLDVVSGEFVMEAIRRARSAQKSVLFSTHIMSEVEALCDRVGLIVRGQIRRLGTYEGLLAEAGMKTMSELIIRLHAEHGA
ncbi:MAG: ABC transporter ATP-binding protein [Myxococcota bacterium]